MTDTPRRQLNVRLPPDLIEQIDDDNRSKQDVVEAALVAYFDDSNVLPNDSDNTSSGSGDHSIVIADKDSQIAVKDQQIAELHVLLRDANALQGQLLALNKRKWWQFWRGES